MKGEWKKFENREANKKTFGVCDGRTGEGGGEGEYARTKQKAQGCGKFGSRANRPGAMIDDSLPIV